MSKMEWMKRGVGLLAAGILLVTGFARPVPASAAPAAEGRLTVTPKSGETPVYEGTFAVYQVGDTPNATATGFRLRAEYANMGIDLSDLGKVYNDADLPGQMLDFLKKAKAAPEQTEAAGAGAPAVFKGLEDGLYLVEQTVPALGYTKAAPFLIGIPEGDNLGYKRQVEAFPKINRMDPVLFDPPVQKRIVDDRGQKLDRGDTFRFKLTGLDGAPMPEGAETDHTKTITITGNTSEEFGAVELDEKSAGKESVYRYRIEEINDGAADYRYDGNAFFTVSVTVKRSPDGNHLEAERTVTDASGRQADAASFVFTNTYAPEKKDNGGGSGGGSGNGGGRTPWKPTQPVETAAPGDGAPIDTKPGISTGTSSRPRSGDTANAAAWIILMGSGVLLLAAGRMKKRDGR